MGSTRTLFRIVVWFGIGMNYAFAVWAVFFDPARLLAFLRLGDQDSFIWLFNYSVLLMILSLFYIPAAHDPDRYRANAWLLIVGRLVPTAAFLVGVLLGFMPRGFLILAMGDGLVGVVELLLLLAIVREERRGYA